MHITCALRDENVVSRDELRARWVRAFIECAGEEEESAVRRADFILAYLVDNGVLLRCDVYAQV